MEEKSKIKRRLWLKILLSIIALIVFVIGFAVYKLEKLSSNENQFEDAMRMAYQKCYEKYGYRANPTGSNIPDDLAEKCTKEVEKELEITH